jgi:hypothetical protein
MLFFALAVVFTLAPGVIATLCQASCWPFEAFTMFSKPICPERLKIIRVVYEDHMGRLHWWKPRHTKLTELFAQEAAICFKSSLAPDDQQVSKLFSRLEHCMPADPRATNIAAICLYLRTIKLEDDGQLDVSTTLLVTKRLWPGMLAES